MTNQTKNPVPLASLKSMSHMIGKLPSGEPPKAWWSSMDKKVLAAYDEFKHDHQEWQSNYRKLLDMLGLPANTLFISHSKDTMAGLQPPKGIDPPRWTRIDKNGVLVPRKRTVAEKDSPVSVAFDELVDIPVAVTRLPGIPEVITQGDKNYPVVVRQPGQAVLAFVGILPEQATERFEVGGQWSRMKMSTYHLLREKQDSGDA